MWILLTTINNLLWHFLLNSHLDYVINLKYLNLILSQDEQTGPNLKHFRFITINWRIIRPIHRKHLILFYFLFLIDHKIFSIIQCQKLRHISILYRPIKHTKISIIIRSHLNRTILIVPPDNTYQLHS